MDISFVLARLIGALKPAGAEGTLLRLLADEDTDTKVAALRALASCGAEPSLRAIEEAAEAQDPAVSAAARVALERLRARREESYRAALRLWKKAS